MSNATLDLIETILDVLFPHRHGTPEWRRRHCPSRRRLRRARRLGRHEFHFEYDE